ncbi:MAG: nucleotidyltransferase family protein [Caldilineaceae bacterium]
MGQSDLQALLLACLSRRLPAGSETELAKLSIEKWRALHELACEQRVSSLFWQRLEMHGLTDLIPESVRLLLQDHYYELTVENLRLYHELGVVLRHLRAQNIPVIVLKGAHLGSLVYPNSALRLMNDVDLLFAQNDIPAVAALFEKLGYAGDETLLLERHFATDHHLPRYSKADSTASFEVHWLITYPDKAYTIAMNELWQRAQQGTIAGEPVLTLCPEDLLLHICEHATYHHLLEQGIRFLCDIDALVSRYTSNLDWAAVQERAKQWGWMKGVYLALTLAQRLLGTPIPVAALDQLQPAHIDSRLVEQAIQQLFADQSESLTVSNEFAQMWGAQSWRQKVQMIGQQIFAPEHIVQRYPVRPGTIKLYLYYPVRLKDLLVRYTYTLWRLWRRDPLLSATTQSKHQLAAWFEPACAQRQLPSIERTPHG